VITAKNYAAQAERGLYENSKIMDSNGYPLCAKNNLLISDLIKRTVHFNIPCNGEIFDKDRSYKGLVNLSLKLPFPFISLEFDTNSESRFLRNGKVVVVAYEEEETVETLCIFNLTGLWHRNNFWFSISKDWDRSVERKGNGYVGQEILMVDEGSNVLEKEKAMYDYARINCHLGAQSVLSLCEALACSNVSTSIIQKAAPPLVAQKRERKGKLPIYETRMLTIDSTNQGGGTGTIGGTHASPRTHLRRGHIRRLDDNRRIWVNACVVGKSGNGIIDKQYAVV